MPINIPRNLPAYDTLAEENIFVMAKEFADRQDIRPIRIAIVNLMPTKIETETQLLRLLSYTPLQADITLIRTATYTAKNTSLAHMDEFYKKFEEIRAEHFDALIITGAPVEHLNFEDVAYWGEICDIMEWAKKHVYSTMYICWGALAGLYYHYGIPKIILPNKLSGVYKTFSLSDTHALTRGFDEVFCVPHSRYAGVDTDDVKKISKLEILACSEETGVHIVSDIRRRNIFVTGHAEYDKYTLRGEYERDCEKGIAPDVPCNYFDKNDPMSEPLFTWRGHASLMFANWLNNVVYQGTPYDLIKLEEM